METNRHLFQNPNYSLLGDSVWSEDFLKLAKSSPKLTWDPAALLSCATYGFACGDRTLFREVRRQPWLSNVTNGRLNLEKVPDHGFLRASPTEIARNLLSRLELEAEKACRGFSKIYILTSGGLDSRIVAGIVKRLVDQDRIQGVVHAVTWGRSGSRDINIGKYVAETLDFQWKVLDLSQEHFEESIEQAAIHLGSLVSPVHLHRMTWLRALSDPDAIVLAGSYGDSVGRAEFSGRSVLELLPFHFNNQFGLLRQEVVESGKKDIQKDVLLYRKRFGNRPEYGMRECEQQCHYMRGMIAQTMSVIDSPDGCRLYQMFTSPEVFGYMWSVHPSFRTNEPYAQILELLGNGLSQIPWARTNRPLRGGAGVKIKSEVNQYHDYATWLMSILDEVDLEDHSDWLESTEMFNRKAFLNLASQLRTTASSGIRQSVTGLIAWTLSLRVLGASVAAVAPSMESVKNKSSESISRPKKVTFARRFLREFPFLLSAVRAGRRFALKRKAINDYPPHD